MTSIDFDRALSSLKGLEEASLDLICTSPPFEISDSQPGSLKSQEAEMITRFIPLARELARVLKPDGSLLLEFQRSQSFRRTIRRSLPYELIVRLCNPIEAGGEGWQLAQDLFLSGPDRFPPAGWFSENGVYLRPLITTAWWLSRSSYPKANNRRVLKPYSQAQKTLVKTGDAPAHRPSGHQLSGKFARDNGGAISPNMIATSDTWIEEPGMQKERDSGIEKATEDDARLLEFAIRLCTETGARVCDPFDHSGGVRQRVTESLGRRWCDIARNP